MIKLRPGHQRAARVLVDGFLSDDQGTHAAARQILPEVIPSAPPALIRALVPLLKQGDPLTREDVAKLLSLVDPQALRRE